MARWPKKEAEFKKPPGEITEEVMAAAAGDVGDVPFAPEQPKYLEGAAPELEPTPYAMLVAELRKQDLIPVRFARLHSPLFFGGKNHGDKLEITQQTPQLSMFWDRANRELHVRWMTEETIVTEANVANYTPGERFHKESQFGSAISKTVPFTAQVSGPQSHVFAGPGHGVK